MSYDRQTDTSLQNHREARRRRDELDDLRQYLERFWSDGLSEYATEIGRQMKNIGEHNA